MTMTSKQASERYEIEALLPWHAAGTLSHRDAQRVEQALASDRDLAQHYEVVREELAETIYLNETLGAPSARAMEKLMAAIDAEGVRKPRASFDLVSRLGGFFSGFGPRTLAWSAGAAALAIVVQAGLLATVFVGEKQGGVFQTASYQQEVPTREGSFAMLRFAPQATAAEITKFLNAYKVSVVDGPRPGGLYRVRVAVTGMPKEQLGRVIQQMQAESVVGFVAAAE